MKLKDLAKIEFWLTTGLYAIAILVLISNPDAHIKNTLSSSIPDADTSPSYLSSFLIPELFRYSILYFSFLLLNFCVLPAFFRQGEKTLPIILLISLFLVTGFTTGILNTYKDAYMFQHFNNLSDAYSYFFLKGFKYSIWLILIISIYFALKKLVIYFSKQEYGINNRMKLDAVSGAGFWFAGLLLLLASSSDLELILSWTLLSLAVIGTVIYSIYYLIPKVKAKNKKFWNYFWKLMLITIITAVPLLLISLIFNQHDLPGIVTTAHMLTQPIFSSALAWQIYKRREANHSELTNLKTELGKSDANLGFLRAQINPHFLFNALNTLYGTALQEKAERTGEGIQKLGDMMRFMLQENHQDKISLARDIDYLNNYIDLQKLRIARSANMVIETQIEDQVTPHHIAPMLLIPFVENAFKHGISLQQPSHIKVTLQTQGNTLYFDVHNSIHLKSDNDPEKLQSGIGLQNVQQRLELLYPNRHELIIRESAKEFFIHLTLQLERNP